MVIYPEGTVYGPVSPEAGATIVSEHLYKGRKVEHLVVQQVAAVEIDTLARQTTPSWSEACRTQARWVDRSLQHRRVHRL